MDASSESAAIRAVQARLVDRFAYLGEDVIATVVAAAQAELTGPIRDFVPVLVERTARIRLSAMTNYSDPVAPRRSKAARTLVP